MADKPKIIDLEIKLIRIDGDTQIREKISERTVEEYAEDMRNGANFPPIVVFLDSEGEYWLSDGFHRVLAAATVDRAQILAEVRQGSLRDAILYACSANATHGLRRTNKDKRNSVLKLLTDRTWSSWSDRSIARQTGTSNTFVSNLRRNLTVNVDSDNKNENLALTVNVDSDNQERTYITKHGSLSTMDTANIGKSSTPELTAGNLVKVKETYGVYPGETGKLAYLANNDSAIVIFENNDRQLIPRNQLELMSTPAKDSSSDIPAPTTSPMLAASEKKEVTTVKQELDAKQEELGLGKGGDSVLPQTDRLDELQHSNPAEVDDRPFASGIDRKEINPNAAVNTLAICAEYLGKDHYRSIGKIITSSKPEAINDVAEVMADSNEKARAIMEIMAQKYPELKEEMGLF